MNYHEALARLRNHSGHTTTSDERSLLYCLWKSDQESIEPELSPHVEDVLACLAVANLEMNGPRPSETFDRPNPAVIADVAYPVACLLDDLLRRQRDWSRSEHCSAAFLEALRDAAHRIALAWEMVLAGDHDDLLAELELEWEARDDLRALEIAEQTSAPECSHSIVLSAETIPEFSLNDARLLGIGWEEGGRDLVLRLALGDGRHARLRCLWTSELRIDLSWKALHGGFPLAWECRCEAFDSRWRISVVYPPNGYLEWICNEARLECEDE